MTPRKISLFSGIGGFDYAAACLGWELVAQVEKDPFAQQVLRHHFGSKLIEDRYLKNSSPAAYLRFQSRTKRPLLYGDIKQFSAKPFRGTIDIISGGFPCQPFSLAGKRAGADDDRYLWEETLRVVDEARPTVFVGENVLGIKSMDIPTGFFEVEDETSRVVWTEKVVNRIFRDLQSIGYRVPTTARGEPILFIIPAVGVNACHKRDRVWFVAERIDATATHSDHDRKGQLQQKGIDQKQRRWSGNLYSENDTDSNGARFRRFDERGIQHEIVGGSAVADSDSNGIGQSSRERQKHRAIHDNQFEKEWFEVAALLCRVDDGLPEGLDKRTRTQIYNLVRRYGREAIEKEIGLDLSKVDPNRGNRFKGLGNAIVPQIAYKLFSCIDKIYFQ